LNRNEDHRLSGGLADFKGDEIFRDIDWHALQNKEISLSVLARDLYVEKSEGSETDRRKKRLLEEAQGGKMKISAKNLDKLFKRVHVPGLTPKQCEEEENEMDRLGTLCLHEITTPVLPTN
jgi:hypothetical protein